MVFRTVIARLATATVQFSSNCSIKLRGTCAEGNRISGLMTFPDKTAYMGEFR